MPFLINSVPVIFGSPQGPFGAPVPPCSLRKIDTLFASVIFYRRTTCRFQKYQEINRKKDKMSSLLNVTKGKV
jgi:hypothetical protein